MDNNINSTNLGGSANNGTATSVSHTERDRYNAYVARKSGKSSSATTTNKTYTSLLSNDKAVSWIKDKYQKSWSYGGDDKDLYNQSKGLRPSASESKFDLTNSTDYQLHESGLPSMKEIDKYVEEYNAFVEQDAKKQNFYKSVAKGQLELKSKGIVDDDDHYYDDPSGEKDANGNITKVAGSKLYSDVFRTTLERDEYKDLTGSLVYDSVSDVKMPTYKDDMGMEHNDYDGYNLAILKAASKAETASEKYANGGISYDDYYNNYADKYKGEILASTASDGRTYEAIINDNIDAIQRGAASKLAEAYVQSDNASFWQKGKAKNAVEAATSAIDERVKNKEITAAEGDAIKKRARLMADEKAGKARADSLTEEQKDSFAQTVLSYQPENAYASGILSAIGNVANGMPVQQQIITSEGIEKTIQRYRENGASDEEITSYVDNLSAKYGGILSAEAKVTISGYTSVGRQKQRKAKEDVLLASVIDDQKKNASVNYEAADVDDATVSEILNKNIQFKSEGNVTYVTKDSLESAISEMVRMGVPQEKAEASWNAWLSENKGKDAGDGTVYSGKVFYLNDKGSEDSALEMYMDGSKLFSGNGYRKAEKKTASDDADKESILATREILSQNGMSEYDIDQALRRNGYSTGISEEQEVENYYKAYGIVNDVLCDGNHAEALNTYLSLETDEEKEAFINAVYDNYVESVGGIDVLVHGTQYSDPVAHLQNYVSDMQTYIMPWSEAKKINPEIDKTAGEQIADTVTRVIPSAVAGIADTLVNFADMVDAGLINKDRTTSWEVTKMIDKAVAGVNTFGYSSGQSNASDVINFSGEVASELARMYMLNAMGQSVLDTVSGLASKVGFVQQATAINEAVTAEKTAARAAKAAGENFVGYASKADKGISFLVDASRTVIQSQPFIASSIGSYYSEALNEGATIKEATAYGTVCGALEGLIETLNMDKLWGKTLGNDKIANSIFGAKQILSEGSINAKLKLINVVSSMLGEAGEEGFGYLASLGMKKITYNNSAEFDAGELVQNMLVGGLIGGIGTALQLGEVNVESFMNEYGASAQGYSDLIAANGMLGDMPSELKANYAASGKVLSVEEFRQCINNIKQAELSVDTAMKQIASLDTQIEKSESVKSEHEAKASEYSLKAQSLEEDAQRNARRNRGKESAKLAQHYREMAATEQKMATEAGARTSRLKQQRETANTSFNNAVEFQASASVRKSYEALKGHCARIDAIFKEDVNAMANNKITADQLKNVDKKLSDSRSGNGDALYEETVSSKETSPAEANVDTKAEKPATAETPEAKTYTSSREDIGPNGEKGAGAMAAKYGYRTAANQFIENTMGVLEDTIEGRAVLDAASEFDKDLSEHKKVTNRESMEKAAQRLSVDFQGEMEDLGNRENWNSEDVDTGMGILMALRAEAFETHDWSDYYKWLKHMSILSSETGAALNAFKKYSETTAEGIAYEAQHKATQKVKEVISPTVTENGKSVPNKKYDKKKADSVKEGNREAKELITVSKEKAVDKISDFILDIIPYGRDGGGNGRRRSRRSGNSEGGNDSRYVADSVAEMIINRVRGKMLQDATDAANRFPSTEYTGNDRISEVDVRTVINELFDTAVRSPIEGAENRTIRETPEDKLRRLNNLRDQYKEVFDAIRSEVFSLVQNDPNAVADFEAFFGSNNATRIIMNDRLAAFYNNENPSLIPDSLISSVYNNMKKNIGINIKEIITKPSSTKSQIREGIVQYLRDNALVTPETEAETASRILGIYNKEIKDASDNFVRSLLNKKAKYGSVSEKRNAKTALKSLEERANAGAYIDEHYIGEIAELLPDDLKAVLREGGVKLSPDSETVKLNADTEPVSLGEIVAMGDVATNEQMSAFLNDVAGIDVDPEKIGAIMEAAISVFNDAVQNEKNAYLSKLIKNASRKNEQKRDAQKKMTDIEKTLRAANMGIYDNESIDSIVLQANGLPSLTRDDIASIHEYINLADSAEKSGDDYMVKMYREKAAQIIADKTEMNSVDKMKAVRRIFMLLNSKTLIKNDFANAPMAALETIKDAPGSGVDMLVSKYLGTKRTTSLAGAIKEGGIEKAAKGYVKGIQEAALDYKYGVNTNFARGRYEENIAKNASFGESKLGNIMDEIQQKLGNLMGFGDRKYAQMAYEYRCAELSALGYNMDRKETYDMAVAYALDRVFQNNSKMAKAAVGLRNSLDGFGIPIGSIVLPFAQTPANIADKLLDYAPLIGLFRGGVEIGKLKNDIKKGNMTEYDIALRQKKGVDSVSRSITGMGMMLLGAMLRKTGLLTGGADNEDEASLFEQAGAEQYAIKLGDMYFTIDWAEPAGTLVLMGAEVSESMMKSFTKEASVSDEIAECIGAVGVTSVNSFFNNSFLQSFTSLFSKGDVAGAIKSVFSSYVSQSIPTVSAQAARVIDPYDRDTYDPNFFAQTAKQAMNRIPGLRQLLAKKVDTNGQEKVNSAGRTMLDRVFNSLLLPAYYNTTTENETSQELFRLYNLGYDDAVLPVAGKKVGNITLTADQRREYREMLGTAAYAAVEKIVSNPNYQNLDDDKKAKLIKNAIRNAEDNATDLYKEKHREDFK